MNYPELTLKGLIAELYSEADRVNRSACEAALSIDDEIEDKELKDQCVAHRSLMLHLVALPLDATVSHYLREAAKVAADLGSAEVSHVAAENDVARTRHVMMLCSGCQQHLEVAASRCGSICADLQVQHYGPVSNLTEQIENWMAGRDTPEDLTGPEADPRLNDPRLQLASEQHRHISDEIKHLRKSIREAENIAQKAAERWFDQFRELEEEMSETS